MPLSDPIAKFGAKLATADLLLPLLPHYENKNAKKG